jgi:rubrerythrin
VFKLLFSEISLGGSVLTKTETNLQAAIAGEAKARPEYTAFAMQAMQEGHPEIAQLFLEAAGAETIHGISHMRAAREIGMTIDNLDEAANGEDYEIEEMYPRFVGEAEEDGRSDALPVSSSHLNVRNITGQCSRKPSVLSRRLRADICLIAPVIVAEYQMKIVKGVVRQAQLAECWLQLLAQKPAQAH